MAEFKCLSNLTTLTISLPCPHLIDPKYWHFEKLIKFHIGMGCNIGQENFKKKNYEFLNRLDVRLKVGERIHQRMGSLINTLLKETEILNVEEGRGGGGGLIFDFEAKENLFDLLQLSGGSPSLSRLQSLKVRGCDSLKYVLPVNTATDLLQLKSLVVCNCDMIEEVFHLESSEGAEAADAITIKLPQLTNLELQYLPKLTPLSKSAVSLELPQLTTLDIWGLNNLKSVFTSTPLSSNTEPSLFTLLPASDWTIQFQNLQYLRVSQCFNMEHIIGEGGEEDKEGAVTVLFPQLAQLQLDGLDNLVSFFSGNKYTLLWMSMDEVILVDCPKMKTFKSSGIVNDTSHDVDHYLFNDDVTWVKLRTFEIRDIGCEMIWHCKTQVSVEEMKVSVCHKLKNVLAYSSGDGIKMVESLFVSSCESPEVVFQIEYCDQEGADLLCNGLRDLSLSELPELKRIWNISSCGDPHLTIQLQAAFTKQFICIGQTVRNLSNRPQSTFLKLFKITMQGLQTSTHNEWVGFPISING